MDKCIQFFLFLFFVNEQANKCHPLVCALCSERVVKRLRAPKTVHRRNVFSVPCLFVFLPCLQIMTKADLSVSLSHCRSFQRAVCTTDICLYLYLCQALSTINLHLIKFVENKSLTFIPLQACVGVKEATTRNPLMFLSVKPFISLTNSVIDFHAFVQFLLYFDKPDSDVLDGKISTCANKSSLSLAHDVSPDKSRVEDILLVCAFRRGLAFYFENILFLIVHESYIEQMQTDRQKLSNHFSLKKNSSQSKQQIKINSMLLQMKKYFES